MPQIFQSQHVELIYKENESDYLVVTFNPANIRANGKRFWGDNFLEKNRISAMGFVSKKPNWFPYDSMVALCEAARPFLARYKHIVTYGCSMGAYGAVKYSRMIGANTVAAFSPQHTINKADNPVHSPYHAYYDPGIHQNVTIKDEDLGGKIFLFYDPHHHADLIAADHVARLYPITRIKVPLIGHTTIEPFANARAGMEILRLCMAGQSSELHGLSRKVRRPHLLRKYHMACGLIPKHIRWSLAICDKFPEILDEKRLDKFVINLRWNHQLDFAIAWTRDYVARNPGEARGYKNLAGMLAGACDYSGAADAIRRALEIDPGNYHYIQMLVRICTRAKQFDEGVLWARRALEINPRHPLAVTDLATLYYESGRPDEAVKTLEEGLERLPGKNGLKTLLETIQSKISEASKA